MNQSNNDSYRENVTTQNQSSQEDPKVKYSETEIKKLYLKIKEDWL